MSETVGFVIELVDYNALRSINKELFGDGSALTSERRRDLANLMFVVLSNVEKQPIEGDGA